MIRFRSDPNDGTTAHFWTKPAAVVCFLLFFYFKRGLLEFSCVLIVTNHSEIQEIRRKTHLPSMGDVNVLIPEQMLWWETETKRLKNTSVHSLFFVFFCLWSDLRFIFSG